jgi:hypothetical protein
MSYALVHDVAASWERYAAIARSVGHAPPGLLLHVAGPTDEGFRIIEVWESETAWRQFAPDLEAAFATVDPSVGRSPIVRDLHGVHLIVGESLGGAVGDRKSRSGSGT